MATPEVKPKEIFFNQKQQKIYISVGSWGSQDLHDLADERTSYQHEN